MFIKKEFKANFERFISSYDSLKAQGQIITNSCFNTTTLSKFFNEKSCVIHNYAKSFFVLIPLYDYYEVLFYSISLRNLEEDLHNLKQFYSQKLFRLRIITRKLSVENAYHNIFEKIGFQRKGRLIRFVSKSLGISKYTDALRDFIEKIPSQYRHVGYAEEKDAKQVLELLESGFDEVLDSLPELDDILDNIKKNQVIVVKDDNGLVLSLRYFTIEGSVCNVFYEITRHEFRKMGVFYLVILFFVDELHKKYPKLNKFLGWRNAERTELIKFSKSMGDIPDGTVISVYTK